MTDAVKQRLDQLRTLLNILDQRREKVDGEHTADLQEKICAIELAIAHYEAALKIEGRIALLQEWEAARLDTNWQQLYKAALFELNPNKLVTPSRRRGKPSLNKNRERTLQNWSIASW